MEVRGQLVRKLCGQRSLKSKHHTTHTTPHTQHTPHTTPHHTHTHHTPHAILAQARLDPRLLRPFLSLPIRCYVRDLWANCACAVELIVQPRASGKDVGEGRRQASESGGFWGFRTGTKLSQGTRAHQCGRRGEHGDGGVRFGQEPGRASGMASRRRQREQLEAAPGTCCLRCVS